MAIINLASSLQAAPNFNSQNVSPFVELMTTPVIDPYYLVTDLDSYYTHDLQIEASAKKLVTSLLKDVQSCLVSPGEKQKELKDTINRIISRLPEIRIYHSNSLNTTSQFRFGASNLINQRILINSNYPRWTEQSITQVFYLHEMLEALGYQDRWYHLTGAFWSTYRLCSTKAEKNNPYFIDRLQLEDFASTFLNIFGKIEYNFEAPAVFPTGPENYIAGGGVTGIDGGGDPMVAFFQANLFEQALKADLLNPKLDSFINSILWSLMGLKTEGVPGVVWLRESKNRHAKKSGEEYNLYLNEIHQKMKNEKVALELIDNLSMSFGFMTDNSVILIVDTQLLHWLYNQETLHSKWASLSLHVLKTIVNSTDLQTNKLDTKRLEFNLEH